MSTHRSKFDSEMRAATVAWLRRARPLARIMHETRIAAGTIVADLLAVSPLEIIAVEFLSERDRLDRAPAQIAALRAVAHHAVCVLDRRFFVPRALRDLYLTHPDAVIAGDPVCYRAPPELCAARVLAWPEPDAPNPSGDFSDLHPWAFPPIRAGEALPPGAVRMLRQAELASVLKILRVDMKPGATFSQMVKALHWFGTGAEIARLTCAALRARECPEADPPLPGAGL